MRERAHVPADEACQHHVRAAAAGPGTIRPLPATVHPLSEAPAALRQLAAAKHTGKVVIQVRRRQMTSFGVVRAAGHASAHMLTPLAAGYSACGHVRKLGGIQVDS